MNKNPKRENLKPFKKGKDDRRNLKGRPTKLPELDKLLIDVLGEEKDGIEAAKAVLMALRNKAIRGDVRAAEVLLERAYGKTKQNLDLKAEIVNYNTVLTKKEIKEIAKGLDEKY